MDEVYVSTDSVEIMDIARKNDAYIIERLDYLCTEEAPHQDAMIHGYHYVKNSGKNVELVVLLRCNAPVVSAEQIDEGIEILREHPDYDSAVTVSKYNMYSPVRARHIGEDGLIHSFVSFELFVDINKIACDKSSRWKRSDQLPYLF